ncbi:Aste57867_1502 [Aphanomyces stellatus]|uniref:BK channel n=1 Tax=Aphanomyces stellatus TaxID=120398 RepID=A0A485K6E9_9STRA|nr:hypothetical protein As57867_001501 [Aphanomyces stellatus]VFT78718.1 Aste57867_1502 [Aphanomyces stellatus]
MLKRAKGGLLHVGVAVKAQLKKVVKPRMRGENFRKWVGRNIDNSLLASSIDIFQVVLGLLVTIVYFNQNWTQFSPNLESTELAELQMVIGVFFTLDYIMRFYAADSRQTFFWSPFAIIDLITILPQWFEMLFESDANFKSKASAMKTLRALRFLRAYRLLVFAKTAKGRQGGVLFLTVMSIIICSAGVVQAVEACGPTDVDGKNCQTLEIYNACYFVVITIATLGYGDIAPKTSNGKVCVIFLIFFTGILLPLQISRYSDILSRETEYDKAFKEKKEKNPHILICGEVNSSPLDFFLRQFLHPNNMNWKDKVVILCPSLPSHNLKRILLNSAYEQRVMYLKGSAMLDSDLKRAGAANARLCFVMLNKMSMDGDRSDTASNLLTISLRHHTKRVPLFVQVLKTDNIRHVHLSGASNIVCIDQLKMGLLAKTCLVPGLCALLCNILFTFRPFYKLSSIWASEFLHGCAHDIYEARIPQFLDVRLSFALLAKIAYAEIHVVMMGVTDNIDEFRLFPAKIRMRKGHTILVLSKTPDCTRWFDALNLATLQKYQSEIPEYGAIVEAWNDTSFSGRLKTTRDNMRKSMSLSRGTTFRNLTSAQSRIDPRTARTPVDRNGTRIVPVDVDANDDDDDDDDDDDGVNGGGGDSNASDADAPVVGITQPPTAATSSMDVLPPVEEHASQVQLSAPDMPSAAGHDTITPLTKEPSAAGHDTITPLTKEPSAHKELAPVQVHDHHRMIDAGSVHALADSGHSAAPLPSIDNVVTPATAPPPSTSCSAMTPPHDHHLTTLSSSLPNMQPKPSSHASEAIPDLQSKQSISYTTFVNFRVPNDLSNHIILCGMPNMLHDFVAPLRLPHPRRSASTMSVSEMDPEPVDASFLVPIVIISQIPMTEKQHASIASFDRVYYLHGSPLHETVLREAGVFLAKSIVILSSCTQSATDDEQDLSTDFIDQNMIDTDAITLHRFITEACESNCPMDSPLPTVVIELSRPSSLRFLKDEHLKTEDSEVSKEIKSMTKQVLSRADDPLDNVCHPLYAAGKVCVSNFLDALLGTCNSYGTIIDLFHLLILGEPLMESSSKPRRLCQIPIPGEFWGSTYGDVFIGMLKDHVRLMIRFVWVSIAPEEVVFSLFLLIHQKKCS